MNRTEKLYDVITRNKQVRLKALLSLGLDKSEDKNKVVEYCNKHFPSVYEEAVSIVDNPNRKILSVYEDDLQHFGGMLSEAEYDNDELINLFNDYLDMRDLKADFKNYLDAVKKGEIEKDYCMYVNLDDHYRNFTK